MFLPRLQYLLEYMELRERPVLESPIEMSKFYAPTVKRTSLYSPEGLDELVDASAVPVDKRRELKSGPVTVRYDDGSFQGGSGLKETQEYTPEFGAAVLHWYLANEQDLKQKG